MFSTGVRFATSMRRIAQSAALAGLICLAARGVSAAETLVRTADEFQRAAATAAAGDVIRLAAGEWRDVDLRIEARGTAAAPITVIAERPGETFITGTSRLRLSGEHVVVSGLRFERAFHPDAVLEFRRDSRQLAAHCRVTDCAFRDCNPPGETTEDAKYVSIYGRCNRLDHCELSGKRTRGTTLVVWLTGDDPGRHQIDHNLFGPRPVLKRNGGETIRVGDSQTSLTAARCVVEANLFVECNGEAEIISNKSCENIYRHNTFRDCSGALTLRHGHRCVVEGNWFFGTGAKGTGGVRVIGEGHRIVNNYLEGLTGDGSRAALCLMTGLQNGPLSGYSPVRNVLIAHNTILNCKQPLLIGYGDDDVAADAPPRDCTISRNVIAGSGGSPVTLLADPQGFRGDGNVVDKPGTNWPAGVAGTVAIPSLTAGPDRWLRLAPDETLRGGQEPLEPTIDRDIDGQPRSPQPVAGCDEPSPAPALYRPLTSRDVGPSW